MHIFYETGPWFLSTAHYKLEYLNIENELLTIWLHREVSLLFRHLAS